MDKRPNWDFQEAQDPRVRAVMRRVPRHLFVSENQRALAYENVALPISCGQTISQPFIVAFMTEQLQPQPSDHILEIGCGSGYQAAVLSELVAQVFSIEIDPVLAREARDRLKGLGYKNVTVRTGDGFEGWPEEAPFDAIIVTAAAGKIPAPLVEQLRNGGKMVIPVGPPTEPQILTLVEKTGTSVITRPLLSVRFVPFRRESEM